jgi:uncharacterized protein (DUF2252 family)
MVGRRGGRSVLYKPKMRHKRISCVWNSMSKPKMPARSDRPALLKAARTRKMARSAHAYVRGNTAQFYEWLDDAPVARRVPQGPPVWICGDCHLGNLGPVSDGDGRIEIQIRDLDQAVIGNPAHDLIRLGLSLASAARGSDLPGVVTARMIEEMVEGYAAAIRDPVGGDPGDEPDVVRSVRRRAFGRGWKDLARERLDDVEPTLPLGRKFWTVTAEEKAALETVFAAPAVVELILSLQGRDAATSTRMIDAAYWMKGCSSLGLLRYAAIVALTEAKHRPGYALVDLKEAVAPVAPVAPGARMPRDNARRVVEAARALSPYLGERMIAVRLLRRSVFIRELAPQDLKLEVDQFNRAEAIKAARHLAFVVARAHARQMDDAARAEWLRALDTDRRGMIDAPSWLWESVVALAGRHEVGYLEHCRRYALA